MTRPTTRPSAEEWAELCKTHTGPDLQEMFGRTWWTIWDWSRKLGAEPIGGASAKKRPEERRSGRRSPVVELPVVQVERRLHYWMQGGDRLGSDS